MFIFDKNTWFIGGTFLIDPSRRQGVQNMSIMWRLKLSRRVWQCLAHHQCMQSQCHTSLHFSSACEPGGQRFVIQRLQGGGPARLLLRRCWTSQGGCPRPSGRRVPVLQMPRWSPPEHMYLWYNQPKTILKKSDLINFPHAHSSLFQHCLNRWHWSNPHNCWFTACHSITHNPEQENRSWMLRCNNMAITHSPTQIASSRSHQDTHHSRTPGEWSKVVFFDCFLAGHHHSSGTVTDAWTMTSKFSYS